MYCLHNLRDVRTIIADVDECKIGGIELQFVDDITADAWCQSCWCCDKRGWTRKKCTYGTNWCIFLAERVPQCETQCASSMNTNRQCAPNAGWHRNAFDKTSGLQHFGGHYDNLPLPIHDALGHDVVCESHCSLSSGRVSYLHLGFSTAAICAVDSYGLHAEFFLEGLHLCTNWISVLPNIFEQTHLFVMECNKRGHK